MAQGQHVSPLKGESPPLMEREGGGCCEDVTPTMSITSEALMTKLQEIGSVTVPGQKWFWYYDRAQGMWDMDLVEDGNESPLPPAPPADPPCTSCNYNRNDVGAPMCRMCGLKARTKAEPKTVKTEAEAKTEAKPEPMTRW